MSEKPLGNDRFILSSSIEQIQEDISGVQNLEVNEIFFDPVFSEDGTSIDRFLSRMEQLR